MDEVSLLLDLLSNNWSSNATALVSAGTISASHAVTPDFLDVRNDVNHQTGLQKIFTVILVKLLCSSLLYLS